MVGDITNLNQWAVRVGMPIRFIATLAERRRTNGFPEPFKVLSRTTQLYLASDLDEWWEAYLVTHPKLAIRRGFA